VGRKEKEKSRKKISIDLWRKTQGIKKKKRVNTSYAKQPGRGWGEVKKKKKPAGGGYSREEKV